MAVQLQGESSRLSLGTNTKITQNTQVLANDGDTSVDEQVFTPPQSREDDAQSRPQQVNEQQSQHQQINERELAANKATVNESTANEATANETMTDDEVLLTQQVPQRIEPFSFSQSLLAHDFKNQTSEPLENQGDATLTQQNIPDSQVLADKILLPENSDQVERNQADGDLVDTQALASDELTTKDITAKEPATSTVPTANVGQALPFASVSEGSLTMPLQTTALEKGTLQNNTLQNNVIKNDTLQNNVPTFSNQLLNSRQRFAQPAVEQGMLNTQPIKFDKTRSSDLNAQLMAGFTSKDPMSEFRKGAQGVTTQVVDAKESSHVRLTASLFSQADQSSSAFQWRKEELSGSPAQWGQKLLSVLSEKVSLQMGQHVQKAQIRLDPPNLGSIDISINVDGDKTTVNLTASNAQVREAMQQTLDQLKQSFSDGQNVTINVDLSNQQHSHGSESEQPDELAISENLLADENEDVNADQKNKQTDWLNRLV